LGRKFDGNARGPAVIGSSTTDCCSSHTRSQPGVASALQLIPTANDNIMPALLRFKVLWQHFCQILSKSVWDKISYNANKKGWNVVKSSFRSRSWCRRESGDVTHAGVAKHLIVGVRFRVFK